MRIERYQTLHRSVWDEFVRRSKNGTFLFHRDYMDYHKDRFIDYSLLIFDDKGHLVALLPANKDGNIVLSHGGLTYGGFVTDDNMKIFKMLEVFECTLYFLKQNSFKKIIYKMIPHIYHIAPAEEDLYALLINQAKLIKRGIAAAIDSNYKIPFRTGRRYSSRKAVKHGCHVQQNKDFRTFWEILTSNLMMNHQTKPVHSLEEMDRLHSYFPEQIKLFCCFKESAMMGGVVIYETPKVAHAQYIAATEEGKCIGALDLVFTHLLHEAYANKPFFDFGISNERTSWSLNKGLVDQKEGFGARAVVYDHYEIDLIDWKPVTLSTF